MSGTTKLRFVFLRLLPWFICGSLAYGKNAAPETWRCAANGGINALYCYLKINDVRCEYTDLLNERKRRCGTNEMTAIDLAEIASRYGVPLRTFSVNMHELGSCPRPLIVHMDGESTDYGAFLLIISINGGIVEFVNGPTATIQEMDLENFRRVWSGYVLMASSSGSSEFLWAISIGFASGLTFILIYRIFRLRICDHYEKH